MAGDLLELNLDFSSGYTACTNCAYLWNTGNRIMRGGSFGRPATTIGGERAAHVLQPGPR
jgi:hypothetical protein